MSSAERPHLFGDRPIESEDQDTIGRRGFAAQIRAEIEYAPRDQGLVVGVTGPWGCGKTSVINLAVNPLAKRGGYRVIRFNPWLFSGTPQLVEQFLAELRAQFTSGGDRAAAIGNALERYSKVFDPIRFVPVANIVATVASGLGQAMQAEPESVESQREKLSGLLAEMDELLVIVVDDIDRLRDDEVADVMRLVRLIADFPNTVYVLAFDIERVAGALARDTVDGYAYIEKIVQVSHEIPMASGEQLSSLALERIRGALVGIDFAPELQRWSRLFLTFRRYFETPRDVGRYGNHVRTPAALLADEVDLADVLALEALRLFEHSVWQQLPTLITELTSLVDAPNPFLDVPTPEPERLVQVVENANRPDLVRELVRELFPAGGRHLGGQNYADSTDRQWRRERRVANKHVLQTYLSKQLEPDLVPAATVEAIVASARDSSALWQLSEDLTSQQLADLLSRLEDFEGDFPTAIAPAISFVYGLTERLPPREGFLGIEPGMRVMRVVLRLLRGRTPTEVASIVTEACAALGSLSDRWALVLMIGRIEGAGHDLVSVDDASDLERRVLDGVLGATAEGLAQERDLNHLMGMAVTRAPDRLRQRVGLHIADDRFLLALIAATRQELRSDHGERTIQLLWDSLLELVGDDDLFVRRIMELPDGLVETGSDAEFLLAQARRYAVDPDAAKEEVARYRKRLGG
jgi:predicted KAP-like P-loop ATPase